MRYLPFYLWRKRRQLIPWEIWLTTKLILLLINKSVLSTSEPQLRIIYLYMCVHDLQWCVASGAPIVWNGDSPAGIRVVNGGGVLLTGEANVKREEEFERERDEEIYVYSMKIPRFHPFHFISQSEAGMDAQSDQVKSHCASLTFSVLVLPRPQIEAPLREGPELVHNSTHLTDMNSLTFNLCIFRWHSRKHTAKLQISVFYRISEILIVSCCSALDEWDDVIKLVRIGGSGFPAARKFFHFFGVSIFKILFQNRDVDK